MSLASFKHNNKKKRKPLYCIHKHNLCNKSENLIWKKLFDQGMCSDGEDIGIRRE